MPNGATGFFPLESSALIQMLGAMPAEAAVAEIMDDSYCVHPLTAGQLISLVHDKDHPNLGIIEQDHTYYVIYVGNSPERILVSVDAASPLFTALRHCHHEWVTAHPRDKG